MRKLALHLLLPLALLFSQQGAVWHVLAHLSAPAQQASATEVLGATDDADEVCPHCLAYAHLAVSLGTQTAPLPLVTARHEPALSALHAGQPARPPVARGRGPPTFLL
ncbi:hypothetical protein [Pelomonas cellulosilytica]|uniref:DUF2946 domain-containing protein n=1 Tax=Pelomonas cellulosilytica TaxID=2906762 RepID=A0ABS8XUV4_9BURK|nr:hypothetical protein [Pelomonas sp. P8]MCE4554667.1 hypothetical protein [Pelomonas sp. P8]